MVLMEQADELLCIIVEGRINGKKDQKPYIIKIISDVGLSAEEAS